MTSTKTPAAGMTPLPTAGTNEHGTTARAFSTGCRCTKCRDAKNAYQRQAYRLRGYGKWQPYVDATRTRQHLRALHDAGVSYMQIAEQSGLSDGNIRQIANGHTKRVRPNTEITVLGLKAEGMRQKLLSSTGSARRLQALLAIGWPLTRVAPYIGVDHRGVHRLIHQPYIFRSTAEAVVAVYEQLKGEKPEDHGVSLIGAQKSRRLAERNGWPAPLWWEDMGHIDDPDFDPAAVKDELSRNEEAAVRRSEIEHLMSYGLDHETIAVRMDMHPTTVRNIMNELRSGRRRVRGTAA